MKPNNFIDLHLQLKGAKLLLFLLGLTVLFGSHKIMSDVSFIKTQIIGSLGRAALEELGNFENGEGVPRAEQASFSKAKRYLRSLIENANGPVPRLVKQKNFFSRVTWGCVALLLAALIFFFAKNIPFSHKASLLVGVAILWLPFMITYSLYHVCGANWTPDWTCTIYRRSLLLILAVPLCLAGLGSYLKRSWVNSAFRTTLTTWQFSYAPYIMSTIALIVMSFGSDDVREQDAILNCILLALLVYVVLFGIMTPNQINHGAR